MFKSYFRYAYPLCASAIALYLVPQASNVADFHLGGYVVASLLYVMALVGITASLSANTWLESLQAGVPDVAVGAANPVVFATIGYGLAMLVGARLAWWLPLAGVIAANLLCAGVLVHWRFKMRQIGLEGADADRAAFTHARASGLHWGLPALLVTALIAFH